MVTLTSCPTCNENSFEDHMLCKDHFLSKEDFHIVKCKKCGLLFTNPRPEKNIIGQYYKSKDYLSHSKDRKGTLNKIYYFVRSLNHKSKYSIISSRKEKGSILDIGCATGEFLAYFKKHGWEVTGIEPDQDARRLATEQFAIDVFPEEKIAELGNKRFDVITLWHVLEHVPDLSARMIELNDLLKDDGLLIIAVPNSKCYDATHYASYWAGYDVPRHLYHFDQRSIDQLFKCNNFICTAILPMKFDAYYVSLLSEKYKNGKNNYLAAFKTGWKSNKYAAKHQNDFSSLIYVLKKEKT